MSKALIIVDVQNDFCAGGSLATERGAEVAALISEFAENHHGDYEAIVATQDWHVDPGTHFSENPDFKDSWPVHCKAESRGAELHEDLDTDYIEAYFHKGEFEAAYSGFEGLLAPEDTVMTGEREAGAPVKDDTPKLSLDDWLAERDITDVDVVGIATDFCVKATALDAVDAGYETRVLLDLTAPVDEESLDDISDELEDAGVTVTEVL
ncbi:isochorismatase family protein [Rothia nasimurium]|uniref:isochorismatase family protein n=1 Tax=Rothia nasimurium TaxID=85336 RepID=UPI0036128F84